MPEWALAPLKLNPWEIPFRDFTSPWGADLGTSIQIKYLVKFMKDHKFW